MVSMQTVTFYTKLNCSLCDKAYTMLMTLAFDIPLKIDIIDITHSHNRLETKYAERIPVVAAAHRPAELDWPFTLDELRAYLTRDA
jgi:hypothetical protein